MKTKAQAEHIFAAVAGFVTRTLDPVRENVGGLIERADKHGRKLEELERRLAALERGQASNGARQARCGTG